MLYWRPPAARQPAPATPGGRPWRIRPGARRPFVAKETFVEDQALPQMPELVPALTVRDPRQSLEWFEKLGFQTLYTGRMPDGSIVHAHVARKGAHLMLGACMMHEPGASGMELYITLQGEDVDGLYERARQAGIAIEQEPTDQFWGDRTFQALHPDGYRITFSQHVRDVSQEELQAVLAQYAAAAAPA
jgi:uncharacterized glyoxalase superfamily protein PhnB